MIQHFHSYTFTLKKCKCVYTKVCAWMFIAASFIIASNGNDLNIHYLVNGKQIVVYADNGPLFCNKNEWTTDMFSIMIRILKALC